MTTETVAFRHLPHQGRRCEDDCRPPENVIHAKGERVPSAAHCESIPLVREYRSAKKPEKNDPA